MELCSSKVIFGLIVASLIDALLAWSVSFGGRPSLGKFVVVQYSFNFLIMDLMVLRGMFKVSDIFYLYPYSKPGSYPVPNPTHKPLPFP